MSAAREKDQSDFDLERFIDMFDEAITSQDPRVIDTLRSLMMIVTLTRPESRDSGLHDRNRGPLRRLFEDVNHLHRRVGDLEGEFRNRHYREAEQDLDKYKMAAAMKMSQSIDADVMQSISRKINTPGGIAIGSNLVQPKGLLNK